jgi:hypothetical protein
VVRGLREKRIRARVICDQPAVVAAYEELARQHPEAGLVVVDSRPWWRPARV